MSHVYLHLTHFFISVYSYTFPKLFLGKSNYVENKKLKTQSMFLLNGFTFIPYEIQNIFELRVVF
jgi:hypothetical protein